VERRRFIERILTAFTLGGLLLAVGCGKKEKPAGFGNQEKLWLLAEGKGKSEEPLDLTYSKETPALFRDASMGKADPNFVPKVAGG
jgi:hypothetical protein